jgi:hypothetical protein
MYTMILDRMVSRIVSITIRILLSLYSYSYVLNDPEQDGKPYWSITIMILLSLYSYSYVGTQ